MPTAGLLERLPELLDLGIAGDPITGYAFYVTYRVRRFGYRLSAFDRQDYVALLDEWKPPPTIDAVEAALSTMIGRSVSRIGEVEIESDVPLPRRDPTGY